MRPKARITSQAIRWLGLKICLPPVQFTHWEISTICRGIQFSEMQRSEFLSRWLNLCLIPTTTPALPQSATTGGHSGIPPLIIRIRDQLSDLPPLPTHLALVFPQEIRRRERGVGRRSDMAYWGEWSDDGSVQPIREPSTATLTLAYQITGNPEFAMRAFRSASTRLMMARRVLRGGREHADMGGAVCSVAAGHGRNWGHGAVTSCYGPLLLGTRERQSAVVQTLEVRTQDGKNCLPENLFIAYPTACGRSRGCSIL